MTALKLMQLAICFSLLFRGVHSFCSIEYGDIDSNGHLDIILPANSTSIENRAGVFDSGPFYACRALKTVALPVALIHIGPYAFF